MILVGPILYSAIGFWMYTNPAIIGNNVKPIHSIKSKHDTNHQLIKSLTEISPGTPFLILFIISVFAKLDHHFKIQKRLFKKYKMHDLNQKLKAENHKIEPDYFDALSKKDRKMMMDWELELE